MEQGPLNEKQSLLAAADDTGTDDYSGSEGLVNEEEQVNGATKTLPWQHATYHSVVSILGVSAVVAMPVSYAYLGWAAGTILFLICTAVSFYSGHLLIECQDATQHRTYSEVADDIMGDGWSSRWVRPFQGLVFLTVLIATVIIVGEFLIEMDGLRNDGKQTLQNSAWTAISGLLLLIVSLAPDVEKSWQVSFIGTVATIVAIIMTIVASGLSIGQEPDVSYDRPEGTQLEFAIGVMTSFGILAFGYGGHSVIPDVHASLGHEDAKESRRSMLKAWRCAYFVIAPSYILVICLAYAAFGSSISGNIFEDIIHYMSHNFMWALLTISLLNQFALGAIYNQAAFTSIEDVLIMVGSKCCGCTILSKNEHASGLFSGSEGRKHWHTKLAIRVLYVGLGTFLGCALPFFGDIAALSGAVGFTPCTFIFPFWLYNKSPIGQSAPAWKRTLNWVLMVIFTGFGVCASIGAVYSIVQNASTYKLFQ
ncbi:hypothetical protein ACHAWF_014600 [Thalassiosira exigua]